MQQVLLVEVQGLEQQHTRMTLKELMMALQDLHVQQVLLVEVQGLERREALKRLAALRDLAVLEVQGLEEELTLKRPILLRVLVLEVLLGLLVDVLQPQLLVPHGVDCDDSCKTST